MADKNVCHNQILPFCGNNCVKLILFQRNVYKFTIKSNDALKRILQDYGEIQVQHELENVIFHILNLIQKRRNEQTVCTSLLKISIYVYPWQLSSKIRFKSDENEFYSAAEQQFLFTFLDKNQNEETESSLLAENKRIRNSDNLSDILYMDSEINEIKKRQPKNDDPEIAVKKLKICKMEEERLRKLSDIQILDIPKVQNPKRQGKKKEGILFRIFRYIFG
ncbi:hypothetical protein AVEN_69223-1 [Araneus ventricosus]|uniref:Uncharacterized protein n=1 Tax=Araneus ventricosus TaxID=182803 RepID=A0A4Y2ER43_ARAVE|nr:hypothetical protein AVEN_69223-1 [Araneus ventricosus]